MTVITGLGRRRPHLGRTAIGTRIVFTRIGTPKGNSWHGSISVKRSGLSGKTYSLAGTFAVRWCGTTRT